MKMFVILKRRSDGDPAAFAAHGDEEWRTAFSLVVGGPVREIYSMADGGGAVMVVEADDAADVKAQLDLLPFMKNNLLDVEIIPVAAYRGFALAIEPKNG